MADSPTPEIALAEALHDAMCDVSHHDSPEVRRNAGMPERPSCWARYPHIVASVVPRLAARGWRLVPSAGEPLSEAYALAALAALTPDPDRLTEARDEAAYWRRQAIGAEPREAT